jgi:hypothetical protein
MKNRLQGLLNAKTKFDLQFEELLREATKIVAEKSDPDFDRTWQEHNERLNQWTNGQMEDY